MLRIIQPLFDLIAPPLCVICREEVGLVCQSCDKRLEKYRITQNFCLKCGGVFEGRRCPRCRDTKFAFEFNRAVFVYEREVQTLVEDFKYRKIRSLASFMAQKMVEVLRQEYPEIDVIVPVPLHPTKRRERGFSQTSALAEEISRITGIKMVKDNLVRIRNTKAQANLSRAGRIENIKGAFRLRDSSAFKGKRILLVDDVMTTGTTMNEAAKLFKKVKGAKVYSITFAIATF